MRMKTNKQNAQSPTNAMMENQESHTKSKFRGIQNAELFDEVVLKLKSSKVAPFPGLPKNNYWMSKMPPETETQALCN